MNQIDLGTRTIHQIIQLIKKRQIRPGQKLPTELQLTQKFKVGRSTVREAIQVLIHSGILKARQGSGTYVNNLSEIQETNQKLWPTQKMLEREAVREIINQPINDNQWLILKARLARRNQLLRQGDFKNFVSADINFHNYIIKLSQNPYLIRWYQELAIPWRTHLNRLIIRNRPYRGNSQRHVQLFKALISRNEALTLKLINQIGK